MWAVGAVQRQTAILLPPARRAFPRVRVNALTSCLCD